LPFDSASPIQYRGCAIVRWEHPAGQGPKTNDYYCPGYGLIASHVSPGDGQDPTWMFVDRIVQ